MATGDVAAAAGLTVFVGTQDIKLGYNNDNVRGDELGTHLISGTHPASAITSGTLDAARIPALDASKVTTGAFTAAQIPSLDASKITTGTLGRPVSTSSACTFSGGLYAGTGSLRTILGSSGIIVSPYTRQNTVSSSYVSVYADGSGNLGYVSSTKKTKQNIVDAKLDLDVLLAARLVNFRYKQAVKDHGDNAAIEIGFIAEEVDALGLTEFVLYDDKGAPAGIDYVKMSVALYAVVQNHEERIKKLEAK